MFNRLRFRWSVFCRQPPGRRFRAAYWRSRRSPHGDDFSHKVARIGLGSLFLLAGAALTFTPVPGMPICVAIAAALFAPESLPLARFLDRTELNLRSCRRALVRRWRRLRRG